MMDYWLNFGPGILKNDCFTAPRPFRILAYFNRLNTNSDGDGLLPWTKFILFIRILTVIGWSSNQLPYSQVDICLRNRISCSLSSLNVHFLSGGNILCDGSIYSLGKHPYDSIVDRRPRIRVLLPQSYFHTLDLIAMI